MLNELATFPNLPTVFRQWRRRQYEIGGAEGIFSIFAFIFQLSELPSASIGGAIAPSPPVPPPLLLDPLLISPSDRLTPAPWYSHMHIQTFIQTLFSICTRLWNSLPPNVSAISTLPAFKWAIVNLVVV